jgi:hypothetical protein
LTGEGGAFPGGAQPARRSAARSAQRQPADPLARWVFAALVIACFAAFFVTQRLKHTPTAVQSFHLTPVFSPAPTGHIKEERISFKLTQAEKVTVTVLDAKDNEVATLASARPVPRYKLFKLRWNGRLGAAGGGSPAPAGEYRIRVSLLGQHRQVTLPRSFTLVRK